MIRFTCGDTKILSNIKMSQNIITRIVDKLDIDKLVPLPIVLSKLSDEVKNDVVKKTAYDKLVAKGNSIDTSSFVLNIKYDTDKTELEKKILDTSGLVKKRDYYAKITEIESKITGINEIWH